MPLKNTEKGLFDKSDEGEPSGYEPGNDTFGKTSDYSSGDSEESEDDGSTQLTDDWSDTGSDDNSENKFILSSKTSNAM